MADEITIDPATIGPLYAATREQITKLLRDLGPDEVATLRVPACPEWTVKDVIAHLTGVCSDILAGKLDGVATDPWTAQQVEARKGTSLGEILDEWATAAPQVEAITGMFPPEAAAQWVADIVSHEHDLRAALNSPGASDSKALAVALEFLTRGFLEYSVADKQLPPLAVQTNGKEWRSNGGEVAATLRGDGVELMRSFSGRRSADQIRKLDWDGDPEVYIPAFEWGPFHPASADVFE
jgi:uncharacterized protein (TIGR03083 family)